MIRDLESRAPISVPGVYQFTFWEGDSVRFTFREKPKRGEFSLAEGHRIKIAMRTGTHPDYPGRRVRCYVRIGP